MLTTKETEFMQVLWEADRPLTAAEIIQLSEDKTWKAGSAHNIINTLLRKKMIAEGKSVQTVKSYARTFYPTIEKEDYLFQCLHEQNLFTPKFFPRVLSAMVEYTDDKETLAQLEEIIKKQKDKQK